MSARCTKPKHAPVRMKAIDRAPPRSVRKRRCRLMQTPRAPGPEADCASERGREKLWSGQKSSQALPPLWSARSSRPGSFSRDNNPIEVHRHIAKFRPFIELNDVEFVCEQALDHLEVAPTIVIFQGMATVLFHESTYSIPWRTDKQ